MKQPLRWTLFALPAIALLGLALFSLISRDRNVAVVHGIQVTGDARFRGAVGDALELLNQKSPEAFEIVQRNVGRIKQSERSGMLAYAVPPTFLLGDSTAYYSPTWCAGSIAHDSLHSKLYHDYKLAKGEPVPDDVWGGSPAVELKCIAHQLKVLESLGAPQHELDYCKTLDGTHGDLDGDGKYGWSDYQQSNW